MGHHMYATLLSKKKKDLWDMFIKGNYSELDLNNVYKKYKDAKKSGQKNAYLHLNEIIEKEDPIMYLQLGALLDTHAYKHTFGSIMTMDDLKKYIDDGGETKIRVHTLPISAYAHKNSEEAFCEAVSLYTIYGSKAVLPKVEYILKEIL